MASCACASCSLSLLRLRAPVSSDYLQQVSRIEGIFRSTCENVMTVLRENRDSLMAMLEAFVNDPLISWRLLAQPRVSGSPSPLVRTTWDWLSVVIPHVGVFFLAAGKVNLLSPPEMLRVNKQTPSSASAPGKRITYHRGLL